MNTEWKDRLLKTIRETEETIRKNENEEHARKITELTRELEEKNREIDALKAKRDELERQVQNESTESKDNKINQKRDELAGVIAALQTALKEKNNLYDELTKNTKELLETNDTIQKNSITIARLTQELEFLRKDLEQKEKIIFDLRIELEQKRRLIEELKEEINQKKETIRQLEE